MITLEQIRLLEERVRRAVGRISALQTENAQLRTMAAEYEERVTELEARIDRFTKDQVQIEDGIKKALDSLEGLGEADESALGGTESGVAGAVADDTASTTVTGPGGVGDTPSDQTVESPEPEPEPEPEPDSPASQSEEPAEEANELDIF